MLSLMLILLQRNRECFWYQYQRFQLPTLSLKHQSLGKEIFYNVGKLKIHSNKTLISRHTKRSLSGHKSEYAMGEKFRKYFVFYLSAKMSLILPVQRFDLLPL